MTGPEHYRAAEALIVAIERATEPADSNNPHFIACAHADMAKAQVHATLALAAATATINTGLIELDSEAWKEVTA